MRRHIDPRSVRRAFDDDVYACVRAAWPYRQDLDCVVEAPDGTIAAYALAWLDEANGVGELEPVGTHAAHQQRAASAVR